MSRATAATRPTLSSLLACWADGTGRSEAGADFVLLEGDDVLFAARSQNGLPAIIVQMVESPNMATARHAGGFTLAPHASLRFSHRGREWSAPAGVLTCTNSNLLETFAALAIDVSRRLEPVTSW